MTRAARRLAFAALALALLGAALAPVAGARTPHEPKGEEDPTPPRNLTLEIQLVSNRTDEAVQDVSLRVMNRWEGENGSATDTWSPTTDGNGTVELEASPGPVRVAVDEPGWQRLSASFRLEGDLGLELELRPADPDLARLAGRVVAENGTPIADAQVDIRPAPDCGEERCPVESRQHEKSRERRFQVNDTTVEVRWRPRDDRTRWLETGEEGRFEARLPAGSYLVEAEKDGYVPERANVTLAENGAGTANLSLRPIPPDSATLRGVVREAGTGDPIPGARILVENPKWGSRDHARTGPNGSFEVTTKPGHVLVAVRAGPGHDACVMEVRRVAVEDTASSGGGSAAVEPEPCEDRPSPEQAYQPYHRGLTVEANATRTLDPALPPVPEPSARIEGWVLDDGSGEALPNATVFLEDPRDGHHARAAVDANGSFAADLPAGRYVVRVRSPGHLENVTTVTVGTDETAQVALRAPAGERLVDEGCCYRAMHGSGGEPAYETTHRSTGTEGGDAEGGASGTAAGGDAVPSATASPIDAGPGGLGPYSAAQDGGERPAPSNVPAAGVALAVAGTTLAAVGLARGIGER